MKGVFYFFKIFIFILFFSISSRASDESVRDFYLRGLPFRALVSFESSEKNKISLSDKLAAAESAWMLGLVNRAKEIWEEVLADNSFKGKKRYQVILSKAILEIQEGNFDKAREIAERNLANIKDTKLKAEFYLLIGESLSSQKAYTQAENYYIEAVERSSGDLKNEALYLLGESQFNLGIYKDARKSFLSIEVNSPYAVRALLRLIEIDFQNRNYSRVSNWIKKGKEKYSKKFENPWIRYVSICCLLELRKLKVAKKELEDFKKWYDEKNTWYELSKAAVESANFKNLKLG